MQQISHPSPDPTCVSRTTRAGEFMKQASAPQRPDNNSPSGSGGVPLDFTDAAFAELLAWSLAQNAGENPSAAPGHTGATAGERGPMPDLEPDKTGGTGPSVQGKSGRPAERRSGRRERAKGLMGIMLVFAAVAALCARPWPAGWALPRNSRFGDMNSRFAPLSPGYTLLKTLVFMANRPGLGRNFPVISRLYGNLAGAVAQGPPDTARERRAGPARSRRSRRRGRAPAQPVVCLRIKPIMRSIARAA